MASDPAPLGGPQRPPVVRLDRSGDAPWLMTPPAGSSPGRTKAKIVAGLTFACTLLSLYDLYLLSAGF